MNGAAGRRDLRRTHCRADESLLILSKKYQIIKGNRDICKKSIKRGSGTEKFLPCRDGPEYLCMAE